MSGKKPTKRETEYFYTDKFNKKQLRFSPKQDEVVVTFQPQPSEETVDAVSTSTSLDIKQSNLKRECAVLEVPSDTNLETASASLDAEDNIANTIPVMVDNEGLTRYFIPDECTVQFKKEVSAEDAERIIEEIGSSVIVKQRTTGYYTIAIPEGKGLFETIRQLSELDEVAFAEPSEFGLNDALVYIPDDPDFGRLWGLRNTGQNVNGTTGTSGADIRATEAWDISRGKPNIIIAVVDTGADLDHPDLQANILPRGNEDWDFAASDDIPEDEASGTHGTHVAGTVGAVDNTTGIIGVAPQCQLMPLRINLTTGMNANRADAINYVADQAAANPNRRYVMNCSWRMSGNTTAVHNAIINAVNNNVVVVFAAGNDNRDIHVTPQYPAVFPEVIAVAAIDQDDIKASFSNFGTEVDVSAPGVNIWSAIGGGNYGFKNGTSMASPHVAGLAALIWSVNPNLTNQQVRQIIESTCDNIDAVNPGFVGQLGQGRINAFRALTASFPLLRQGDSDNLAGFVWEIATIKHRTQQVVTAVRTQSNTLKLISWRVNNDGSVARTGDSGNQAGRASNIDIANGNKYVVACRTSSGRLKLISWDINNAGAITRAGDSGNQAGTASRIKLVALSDTLFVTACRTSVGNLKLISWRLNGDGSITRLNDSGSAAGAVSEISLIEIPRSGAGSRVVTSVRDSDGDLKLIVWDVSSTGAISRRGDSGQQAGRATMLRSAKNEFDDVVTAVRASNGRLKLISWRVSANGNTVTRLGDSGNQAGRIGDNALMSRPDGVLSAVRTQKGNLKLIAWTMTAGGGITRAGDSANQAGTASRITLCQDALSGNAPIVTSVRTASNNLKLITWREQ